ncbi:MAG: protein kinase domain-containing protein [Solirubrobacteraceae bacterium]
MSDLIGYLTPERFAAAREGVVELGPAPDGLGLLAQVHRPADAADLLGGAASVLGIEHFAPGFAGTPLGPLVEGLQALLDDQLVQHLALADGAAIEAIVLPGEVAQISGPTLLARLFGASSTWRGPLRRGSDTPTVHPPVYAPAAAGASAPPGSPPGSGPATPADGPRPFARPGRLQLAIPVTGGAPIVVRRRHDEHGWPRFSYVREYVSETLLSIPQSTLRTPGRGAPQGASLADALDEYAAARLAGSPANWLWRVPRGALAAVIAEVAGRLGELHAGGEVHGDVKFANVLLARGGVQVFDSLQIPAGTRAAALSRGWAAPEQVLGRPLSPAADQYAIGMMLVALVQGVPYGEEATVSIPTGGSTVQRHTLLRDPGVFIDPETAPVSTGAITAWQELIERCIRFAPHERHQSIDELANGLRELAASDTLEGELELVLDFGSAAIGRDTHGNRRPCWLATVRD